jgi:hypothetical protein
MKGSKATLSVVCLILSASTAALFCYGLLVQEQVYVLMPFFSLAALFAAGKLWKKAKAHRAHAHHELE